MEENQIVVRLGERLLFLIEELKKRGIVNEEGKMNSGVFAKSIGIAPPQFSRVTNNEFGLTLEQVMKLCYIYNVRAGWLLEGEMPIFIPEGTKNKDGQNENIDIIKINLENIKKAVEAIEGLNILKDHQKMGDLSLDKIAARRRNGKNNDQQKDS